MNTTPPPKRPGLKVTSAEAQARLADALRENLRRRKAQLRARDAKDAALGKPGEPAGGSDDGKTS
jgi:hypothetical protein